LTGSSSRDHKPVPRSQEHSPPPRVFGLFTSDRARILQREEALETLILEHGKAAQSEEAKKASAYCQLNISEYRRLWRRDERRWRRYQRFMIIGGIVATLAGVISIPPSWHGEIVDSLGWMRGVPAAIVTVAASFLSTFAYRENAVRFEVTEIALWNELVRFLTLSEPYNKGEAENTSALWTKSAGWLTPRSTTGAWSP
jgi:hypothetical protein